MLAVLSTTAGPPAIIDSHLTFGSKDDARGPFYYHGINLTHWGRVTNICISKLTIIGSDNGLSPGRRQAIIWTNAGILFIGPLGTNFNEMLIEIYIFSFKKRHLKLSSGNLRIFYLSLNVLIPAWINNLMPSEVLFEITYLFPNFNGCTVEVWEWICDFNSHFVMDDQDLS